MVFDAFYFIRTFSAKLQHCLKNFRERVIQFPTIQKCQENFRTKDFRNYSSFNLELQANLKEIKNGLSFFTRYAFGPRNFNTAHHLKQLPIPDIETYRKSIM